MLLELTGPAGGPLDARPGRPGRHRPRRRRGLPARAVRPQRPSCPGGRRRPGRGGRGRHRPRRVLTAICRQAGEGILMATIAEVAEDAFRINLEIPGAPIDVSFFVIRDEQPTLVETGFRRAFADTYRAVARVIDPTTLRYGRAPPGRRRVRRAQPVPGAGTGRRPGRQPDRGRDQPVGFRHPRAPGGRRRHHPGPRQAPAPAS